MEIPNGVVERSAVILRAIAAHGSSGVRLRDLAETTGISRPSVHRILQELVDVGFVGQREDKKYTLGSELYYLGMSAPGPRLDMTAINAVLQSLADVSGDTVYIARRQVDGVQYLSRAEGSYPVKALMVEVGQTKPFSSSYAGLALLAGLSEEEQDASLGRAVFDAPEGWNESVNVPNLLRSTMAQVPDLGYLAGSNVVYPGIAGLAAPVPHDGHTPLLAVTISATDTRLNAERIEQLAPELLKAVNQISRIVSPTS